MRFEGTDTSLMVLPDKDEKREENREESGEDFLKAFKRVYKSEFGFLLEGKPVIVDDIKVCLSVYLPRSLLTPAHSNQVRGISKTFGTLGDSVYDEIEHLQSSGKIKPINPSHRSLLWESLLNY